MQPKKQLKVQYIGIFEKKTLFIDQKCTSKKRAMPERKRFFSIDPFPKISVDRKDLPSPEIKGFWWRALPVGAIRGDGTAWKQ